MTLTADIVLDKSNGLFRHEYGTSCNGTSPFFLIACLLFYMCCEGLIISLLFSVTTFAKYSWIQYDHVFAIMSSYALVSYAGTIYRWLVF